MSGERIEAELSVPAPTPFIASTATHSDSDIMFLSTGGTNVFLTTFLASFQTQLNENMQGYPRTAIGASHAIGLVNFAAGSGWLMNETSGSLSPVFGGVTLAPTGTPLYAVAGPRGGIDKAIGFDAAADGFTGATSDFDVNGTDDLVVAWVAKVPTTLTAGQCRLLVKNAGSFYAIDFYAVGGGQAVISMSDGVDAADANAGAGSCHLGEWHVGIAVIERATNRARIATQGLTSGTAFVSAETNIAAVGSLANGANFRLGSIMDATMHVAALYVVDGTNVAGGLSAGLATAIDSFADAINASWSLSLSSTDSRVTLANSFWPYRVPFSLLGSTYEVPFRSLLGFDADIDYPRTPTQMREALGNLGTWTNGSAYLMEGLTPVSGFGSTTLTQNGTPTFTTQGALGGDDKAVVFDTNTEYLDGGSIHDVSASDDLLVVMVWRWSGYPTAYGSVVSKATAGFTNGWAILTMSDPWVAMFTGAASGNQVYAATNNSAFYKGQYCAVIGVVDRSTGRQRIGVINLATGATSISSELSVSGSFANAANFRFGASAWINAPTDAQVSAAYVVTGSGVATGVSASMATALASLRSYLKSRTSDGAAAGIWRPGTNLLIDGDPVVAPIGDDGSWSIAPTGRAYRLMSTEYFRHRNLSFPYVTQDRVWAAHATVDGMDWETFYLETQNGHHSWFAKGARVKVYWDNAGTPTELGSGDVDAWRMPYCSKLDELQMPVEQFTGYFDIRLGDLYTDE